MELTWILADPAYVASVHKQQRVALMLLLPVLLLIAVTFFMMFGSSLSAWRLWALAGILLATAGTLGVLLAVTGKGLRKRLESIRLGASPQGFHFVAPPGPAPVRVVEGGPIPWHDVYFDGGRLLAGKTALMVRLPTGQEIFERAALEREILSRIPKENFVNPARMGFMQLKVMPRWVWIIHGVTFAIFIGMFILTVLKQ